MPATTTQFPPAVALLAVAFALPYAEPHHYRGHYSVAFRARPGCLLIHTEAARSPAIALQRFRQAALASAPLTVN
ncbi:hypothetical protein [Hymenobacter rubidus]|uniref:hypothetical protein n=1 Tax=Hymenobacter rubidus TaxID=1441626 RepID=UPI00191FE7F4|nr:hypothetical protein [Hymenobacter rubidus]